MSKAIKITVIIEDENKSCRKVNMTHDTDMTVMSTLLKEQLVSGAFCGGRGVCQRCRIQFMDSAPLPTPLERNAFNPEELRCGYRLACIAKPRNECVLRLDFIKNKDVDIVTAAPDINSAARNKKKLYMTQVSYHTDSDGQIKFTKNIDTDIPPEYHKNTDSGIHTEYHKNIDPDIHLEFPEIIDQSSQRLYMIAVDLGTTTIAMQLVDMENGRVIDTYSAMNPQRTYGADVLSRIKAAGMGHAESMQTSVWKVILNGVDRFMNIGAVCCMCIAGNTTMEHLLMGLSTKGLGQSPFTPIELGLQKCKLDEYELTAYITPGMSAFVGGDIVAGLYHCNLLESLISDREQVEQLNQDEVVLFIDLGTNGEMAVVKKDRIIVTATAAGPAFEGGAGAAVPGSDMIKLTASLLESGIMDETGLLAEPYFDEGIDVAVHTGAGNINSASIHITQQDIRALQMAKAAVRAGIDVLLKKMPDCQVTRVYLAGGFGYYLDIDSAAAIGLLPETMCDCTVAAGNTSLAGAFKMGRDLYTGRLKEAALHESLTQIESINLAKEEGFDSLYLGYLNFPRP